GLLASMWTSIFEVLERPMSWSRPARCSTAGRLPGRLLGQLTQQMNPAPGVHRHPAPYLSVAAPFNDPRPAPRRSGLDTLDHREANHRRAPPGAVPLPVAAPFHQPTDPRRRRSRLDALVGTPGWDIDSAGGLGAMPAPLP